MPDFSIGSVRLSTEVGGWYSRRDSNLRLLPSEGSTLSTELREHRSNQKYYHFSVSPGNDRDVLNADRLDRTLAFFWLDAGDRSDIVHPVDHLAKDRVFVIKTLFAF